MGKDAQQHPPGISLWNNSPGCMWNVLHNINSRRWNHVRKRLSNRSHESAKHATVVGDTGSNKTTSSSGEMQDDPDASERVSSVEGNLLQPGPVPKSSKRSRIKALITEQVKKRGRHRRSSSEPHQKQLDQTGSSHHSEPLDSNPSAKNALNSEIVTIQANVQSSVAGVSEERAKTPLTVNNLKQTEHWRQRFRRRTLSHGKSKYATAQESKLFLDALDLLNMRQELFMKILQDPNCSFANHLHDRQSSNLGYGLNKSVSFPMPGSSRRRNDKSNNFIVEEESNETSAKDLKRNISTSRGTFMEDVLPENVPVNSAEALKKGCENKVAMKRFKNLGEKLKHAIWESKDEKQRIVMDAVLHKVPYGRRLSKDAKENTCMHKGSVTDKSNKYGSGSNHFGSDAGKSGLQNMKRTSSFCESLDKYNRLLETSCSNQEKYHVPEDLRLKTKTPSPVGASTASLARILSLPDLRSYSYFPSDDSPVASCSDAPPDNSAANMSIGNGRPGEEKSLGRGAESKIEPDNVSESENQEYPSDVNQIFDDNGDLVMTKNASFREVDFERPMISSEMEKLSPVSEHTTSHLEEETEPEIPMSVSEDTELIENQVFVTREESLASQLQDLSSDSITVQENTVSRDTVESRVREFCGNLLYAQEDIKDIPKFNYVRDVLKLSGFTGNETLGKWHSAEQPVDPSVFEEVGGCLIDQPDCGGNEEGGYCYHLVLFDLINEVLLDIYERSFSYWQKPLTCQSRIHQMPIGYLVLKEVWRDVSWYLNWKPEIFLTLDDAVSRDLAKADGWMNLQFDAEFVGIEMEDLIFDELLDELIYE